MLEKRFDFVFSIGEDCGCAENLIASELRFTSSPLDWVNDATFETRIDLLCTEFKGYCSKENLVHEEKKPGTLIDPHNEIFKDIKQGFHFLHDFAANQELDVSYPAVHEKYERRIKRTLARIRQSQRVLMVWWSRDKVISDAVLMSSIDRLQKAFPGVDVNLLICQNDLQRQNKRIQWESVGNHVTRVVALICPNLHITDGDHAMNARIFGRIRLSPELCRLRRRQHFVAAFAWFMGVWHFSHEARKTARARYKAMAERWYK